MHQGDALLAAAGRGDRAALDRVLPMLYSELKSMAQRQLAGERAGHTLHATALVHEVYVKLVATHAPHPDAAADPSRGDSQAPRWNDRAHFFALAARLMRNILVDYARSRQADKRGGDWQRVTLSAAEAAGATAPDLEWEVGALDQALQALAERDARAAAIVEMRCFGGMTIEETAAALEIAPATVKRDWAYATAWLKRAMAA